MCSLLKVNKAEQTGSESGLSSHEYSESNIFLFPLCVTLESKYFESAQCQEARSGHVMHLFNVAPASIHVEIQVLIHLF